MALLISANFFCEQCQIERKFVPIHFAGLLANVTRQTIYRWMHRGWLHWRMTQSGRRLVCLHSLVQGHEVDAFLLATLLKNVGAEIKKV